MADGRLIVLDTNVVLDVLHFNDPATRALRAALMSGKIRAAVTAATAAEWQRVLAYPVFNLDAAQQQERIERYAQVSVRVEPLPVHGVPKCADLDDQKFLELAAQLGTMLVSKDRAVLKLRRRARGFVIVAPDAMTVALVA